MLSFVFLTCARLSRAVNALTTGNDESKTSQSLSATRFVDIFKQQSLSASFTTLQMQNCQIRANVDGTLKV